MSREQDCFETGRAAFVMPHWMADDDMALRHFDEAVEMNHSDRFYREVLRIYPDYLRWDKWLKENGDLIMMRLK